MVWIFILFLIFMLLGCYVAYKEAKIHELHKMRAAFEDHRHGVEELLEKDSVKEDRESEDIFKGELLGFDKALNLLHEEGADEDLVDEIKKDFEALKEKVENLFN